MAKLKVIGWNGVEHLEISERLAEILGGEACLMIEPENGYFYLEVQIGQQVVASSTFSAESFPNNLAEAEKPGFIFRWLWPSATLFCRHDT